jgi:rhodanese-related sulfurtransferase/polyisoprenoid-binding protein YceI
MKFVTTSQVRALREAQPAAITLDVRIAEAYENEHLAGAMNGCVFLSSFLQDVRRLLPDPHQPVIVYGAGPDSLESTEAARHLDAAGYEQVHNFVGGMAEWKGEGLPTVGSGRTTEPPPLEGSLPVDLRETRIEWTGRNLLNKHCGTLSLTSGTLEFRENWLVGGELVIDLTTLRCTDIADPTLNRMLVAHLASPDFLDSAHFPEARVVIRKTSPTPNGRPGSPNLELLCDLTLRGITKPVPVVAVAGRTPEGRIAAQALLVFDRTEFGSAYGSGRFFRQLGQHLVNDQVEIQVRLLA